MRDPFSVRYTRRALRHMREKVEEERRMIFIEAVLSKGRDLSRLLEMEERNE